MSSIAVGDRQASGNECPGGVDETVKVRTMIAWFICVTSSDWVDSMADSALSEGDAVKVQKLVDELFASGRDDCAGEIQGHSSSTVTSDVLWD